MSEVTTIGLPFDEGDDVGVVGASKQITFPMAWDGTILGLGGTLADGDHIEDLSLPRPALCAFGETHLPFGAQMRCQFLLEHPARLDEQTAIDGFMRYPHVWIARVLSPQPARYLLGRPLQRQLMRHQPS
jgi:hypothetical protein